VAVVICEHSEPSVPKGQVEESIGLQAHPLIDYRVRKTVCYTLRFEERRIADELASAAELSWTGKGEGLRIAKHKGPDHGSDSGSCIKQIPYGSSPRRPVQRNSIANRCSRITRSN